MMAEDHDDMLDDDHEFDDFDDDDEDVQFFFEADDPNLHFFDFSDTNEQNNNINSDSSESTPLLGAVSDITESLSNEDIVEIMDSIAESRGANAIAIRPSNETSANEIIANVIMSSSAAGSITDVASERPIEPPNEIEENGGPISATTRANDMTTVDLDSAQFDSAAEEVEVDWTSDIHEVPWVAGHEVGAANFPPRGASDPALDDSMRASESINASNISSNTSGNDSGNVDSANAERSTINDSSLTAENDDFKIVVDIQESYPVCGVPACGRQQSTCSSVFNEDLMHQTAIAHIPAVDLLAQLSPTNAFPSADPNDILSRIDGIIKDVEDARSPSRSEENSEPNGDANNANEEGGTEGEDTDHFVDGTEGEAFESLLRPLVSTCTNLSQFSCCLAYLYGQLLIFYTRSTQSRVVAISQSFPIIVTSINDERINYMSQSRRRVPTRFVVSFHDFPLVQSCKL